MPETETEKVGVGIAEELNRNALEKSEQNERISIADWQSERGFRVFKPPKTAIFYPIIREKWRVMNILNFSELKKKLHLGKTKIYDMIKNGEFPAGTSLTGSGRCVCWLEKDVDAWIAKKFGGAA